MHWPTAIDLLLVMMKTVQMLYSATWQSVLKQTSLLKTCNLLSQTCKPQVGDCDRILQAPYVKHNIAERCVHLTSLSPLVLLKIRIMPA